MKKMIKYKLILGSGSPRRKELLSTLFVDFKILTSDIEEISNEELPSDIVMDLAKQKAESVFEMSMGDNRFVIGADTIVVLDNEILGKPIDREDAKKTLRKLSGKSHEVLTGVCFKTEKETYTFFDKTIVRFEDIETKLMELYLDTDESLDKAGAYGIQRYALPFIKEVQGSYSNVVGFPVNKVNQSMASFLDVNLNDWRDSFE